MALTDRQFERLRAGFAGEVVTPDDADYAEAKRMWNAVHEAQPAALVRPATTDEVAGAIRFAREHDLEFAVRAGGHSPAGHSTSDGGLVIDLSRMRGVEVDPVRGLAFANGGALLGELDVAAQAHGLVCPIGVVGHTGLAGLALGGGVGRLQRHFGLTLDNIRAVELVTADGRVVRASETEEPELFWGIRGAGWNYGVVTRFELALHPFGPDLHRGLRVYPATEARAAWELFRDVALTAPDAVALIYGVAQAETPDDAATAADPVVYISFNHSGDRAALERDTAGLRRGPVPLSESGGTQPYLEVQTAHDLVLGFGRRSYIGGLCVDDLEPGAIDAIVELVAAAPGEGSVSVTAQGGAMARLEADGTAYPARTARFDVSAESTWDEAIDDARNQAWVRRAMAVVEPAAVEGRYVNENSDDDPAAMRAIFGEARLARLAALKRTWDPENVFRRNHNVPPVQQGG